MSRVRGSLKDLPPETLLFASAALLALLIVGPASMVLPLALQIGLLAVAVTVLGLPHGALDSWAAGQVGLYRGRAGWLGFNLGYLLLALVVVVGWGLSPALALTLFLLVSAWHFSTDWQDTLPLWQRLAAGTAVLAMPAVFHPESVIRIFGILSGANAVLVAEGLRRVGLVTLLLIGPMLFLAARRRDTAVVTELTLLLALAAFVSPLVYFAIYFSLLHSPRHLRATLAQAPQRKRKQLIGQAALYTLATVLLAGLVAARFLPPGALSDQVLQLVFIGLAAVTVPHMLLMTWIERARVQPVSAGYGRSQHIRLTSASRPKD